MINVGPSQFFKLDHLFKCLLQDLDKIMNLYLSDFSISIYMNLFKESFFFNELTKPRDYLRISFNG